MSVIVISKPPDDGGGLVAGTPRIKVRIEYTPDASESPQEIERTTRRLNRIAEHAEDL